jgi:hypothetical protein
MPQGSTRSAWHLRLVDGRLDDRLPGSGRRSGSRWARQRAGDQEGQIAPEFCRLNLRDARECAARQLAGPQAQISIGFAGCRAAAF